MKGVSAAKGRSAPQRLRRLLVSRNAVLAALLVCMSVVFSRSADAFLSTYNLLEMTRHCAEIGLMALPMTLILVVAGIDLSVGSILSLCAVVLGMAWQRLGVSVWSACLVAVAAGCVAGALNGLIIAYLRLPALIVTLATMAIYGGLALGMSKAEPVHDYPDVFCLIGQGYLGLEGLRPRLSVLSPGLPVQLLVMIAMAAVTWVFFNRTAQGRKVALIGSGLEVAKCSGVPVERYLTCVYAYSGLMAGMAAVIYVSRMSTAKADAGTGKELDVITAVVLGGTSIAGGRGTLTGSMLGLLVVGVLRNGLDLSGVPSAWQTVGVGSLLIGATLVDRIVRGESS